VRKAVLIPAAVAVVLAGAGAHAVHAQVSGTAAETARMTAIADQLQADPDWGRQSDYVGYLGLICPPDSGCADLQRKWAPVTNLGAGDLQARIDAAGWDLVLNDDCIRKPEDSGLLTLCRGEGAVQGYDVRVSVISESSYRPEPLLILSIF
jgi:hypothetical protein